MSLSKFQNRLHRHRHCEERSDEAIHLSVMPRDGLLRYARNDGNIASLAKLQIPSNCNRASLAYSPLAATSEAWVPCSTILPWSITMMRSQDNTVASRCAITSVVR